MVDIVEEGFRKWNISLSVSLSLSLSVGALLLEPGRGWGFFTGDPEGYVKKGSGNGHLSHLGPRWEPGGWVHLQGTYV